MTTVPKSDDIDALFERGELERAFWAEHYSEMLELYPDEFVATTMDGCVVVHHAGLQKFADGLAEKGLKRRDVFVQFMRTTRRALVL